MSEQNKYPQLKPAGENSIFVVFGSTITPQVREQVCGFVHTLHAMDIKGILEIVPSYCSVMIYFKLLRTTFAQMHEYVETALALMVPEPQKIAQVFKIPVCYDGVLAPDMDIVLRYIKKTKEELLAIHTAKPYLVYMMGFAPGFPYLGDMPFMLPRLTTPRPAVPPGAVGLAGSQTGIYSTETQGEWWLIGRTPLRIFDKNRSNPFLLTPGDYVQFTAISIEEYFAIKNSIEQNAYEPENWQREVAL